MTTPIKSPDPRFHKVVEALETQRSVLTSILSYAKSYSLPMLVSEVSVQLSVLDAALYEARKPLTEVGGMSRDGWTYMSRYTDMVSDYENACKSIAETME